PNAFVAAHLPKFPQKASIFAYDIGSRMPTLTAPGRRIAFLFPVAPNFTPTLHWWSLFDRAVAWGTQGGGKIINAKSEGGGYWFIEGKPTKVLSIEEYRELVEEKVGDKLRKWMIALASGGGITCLSLLFVFGKGYISEKTSSGIDSAFRPVSNSLHQSTIDF